MARFPAGALLLMVAAALWAQQPASSSPKPPAHQNRPCPSRARSATVSTAIPLSDSATSCPTAGWIAPEKCRTIRRMPRTMAKSLLLLAIFERPPEATGRYRKFRGRDRRRASLCLFRHEDCGRLLRTVDRTGHRQRLSVGRRSSRVFIGATQLVRGDFSKPRGATTVRQTSLEFWRRVTRFRSRSSGRAKTRSLN